MYTILEWLEFLPEKVRDHAQAYHGACNHSWIYYRDEEFGSFQSALMHAFFWVETEEGLDYWTKLYESFKPEI